MKTKQDVYFLMELGANQRCSPGGSFNPPILVGAASIVPTLQKPTGKMKNRSIKNVQASHLP